MWEGFFVLSCLSVRQCQILFEIWFNSENLLYTITVNRLYSYRKSLQFTAIVWSFHALCSLISIMVCCLIRPSLYCKRINNRIIAVDFFISILTNLVHEKQWVYNAFIHGFIWCTECTQSWPCSWHLEVVDVSRRTTTNHLEVKLGKY